jgi:hypothetical protein
MPKKFIPKLTFKPLPAVAHAAESMIVTLPAFIPNLNKSSANTHFQHVCGYSGPRHQLAAK